MQQPSQSKNLTQSKFALVTGANSGIGFETARGLAQAGYNVGLLCRDQSRGQRALDTLAKEFPQNRFQLYIADLCDLNQVRRVSKTILSEHSALHLLINNAGIALDRREITPQRMEKVFATNHFGHFLLTQELLPALINGAPARIINLTSKLHRKHRIPWDDIHYTQAPYKVLKVYSESKMMNLLFTMELSRKLNPAQVTANAVHPGGVATNIAGGLKNPFYKLITRFIMPFALPPSEGAKTSLYAALSEDMAGQTGKYLENSAIADPDPYALDSAEALKLWNLSAELCR